MKKLVWLAFLLPSVAFATNYNETRTDLQIVEDHGTSTGWFGCSRHPSSSGCAQSRVIIDHEDRISANKAKTRQNMMGIQYNASVNRSQDRAIRHNHQLGHQNERVNRYQSAAINHNAYVNYRQQRAINANTNSIYELQNDTVQNANDIARLNDELGDTQSSIANVAAMIGSISNIHFDKNSTSLQGALGFGVSDDTKDGQSISFGLAQQTSEGILWSFTYSVAGSTQVIGSGANWDFD